MLSYEASKGLIISTGMGSTILISGLLNSIGIVVVRPTGTVDIKKMFQL